MRISGTAAGAEPVRNPPRRVRRHPRGRRLHRGAAHRLQRSGRQVRLFLISVWAIGLTPCFVHRYWSPLSQVYNVPTVQPKAAYALVWCHVAAFTADLLSYKLAGGSGGDVFLRLALFDDAVVYDSQWLRLVSLYLRIIFPCVWAIRVISCFVLLFTVHFEPRGFRPGTLRAD